MFINKNMMVIVVFLFSLGLLVELSRSDLILRVNSSIANESKQVQAVSALLEEQAEALPQSKFLIIYDPNEEGSQEMLSNLEHQLTYMKKDYEVVDTQSVPSTLDDYQSILFSLADINKLGEMKRYINYVEAGGGIFLTIRPETGPSLFELHRKLGIYELGDHIETTGITLTDDILINGKGTTITEDLFTTNASLAVQLEDVSLYATSSDNTPLMWKKDYGKGRFVMFNGTMLMSKENRGLLAGGISQLSDTFIYPIFNNKIVYIDDFPAPVPSGTNEKIYNEYGKDIRSFYQDIWWRDMQKMAAKYDLKYTGVLIENYNNQVTGSFKDKSGADRDAMIQYGRDLLKMEGEVGIHGYNHQSLTELKETSVEFGYNSWKSQDDMVAALEQAEKFINATLPNYTPVTYVPPSNVLSEMGKSAIKQAMPSIKILSSLYLEDASGMAYVQEFEKNKDFVELPRITSGYGDTEETKWGILNGVTSIGVFSHFIHPDDVLDQVRGSSKTWEEMYKSYHKVLTHLTNTYPWLTSKVSSQAANDLENYEKTKVYLEEDLNQTTIYLNHFVPPFTFVLHSERKITKCTGASYEKIGDNWYLLKVKKEKVVVQFD